MRRDLVLGWGLTVTGIRSRNDIKSVIEQRVRGVERYFLKRARAEGKKEKGDGGGKKRKREQSKFLPLTSASIFSSTYQKDFVTVPTYGREPLRKARLVILVQVTTGELWKKRFRVRNRLCSSSSSVKTMTGGIQNIQLIIKNKKCIELGWNKALQRIK
jgi:hypothetical protein